MATYLELHAHANDSNLQDRTRVAVVVAADNIRSDVAPPANQTARLLWASNVMANPVQEARRMIWAVLAANKAASIAQIDAVTDEQLQTAVDAAVDLFADNS
jgi:hypothetical protein